LFLAFRRWSVGLGNFNDLLASAAGANNTKEAVNFGRVVKWVDSKGIARGVHQIAATEVEFAVQNLLLILAGGKGLCDIPLHCHWAVEGLCPAESSARISGDVGFLSI